MSILLFHHIYFQNDTTLTAAQWRVSIAKGWGFLGQKTYPGNVNMEFQIDILLSRHRDQEERKHLPCDSSTTIWCCKFSFLTFRKRGCMDILFTFYQMALMTRNLFLTSLSKLTLRATSQCKEETILFQRSFSDIDKNWMKIILWQNPL